MTRPEIEDRKAGAGNAHSRDRDRRGVALWRERDGQLWAARGDRRTPVRVHRCFPWSDPERHISLRDHNEDEFAYVEEINVLNESSRAALREALAIAGFLFEVTAVTEVSEEIEIRHWVVETRQGSRRFQTKLEDWPVTVPGGGLLVRDVGGDLYSVPDPEALDRTSRDWLWAYAV